MENLGTLEIKNTDNCEDIMSILLNEGYEINILKDKTHYIIELLDRKDID